MLVLFSIMSSYVDGIQMMDSLESFNEESKMSFDLFEGVDYKSRFFVLISDFLSDI